MENQWKQPDFQKLQEKLGIRFENEDLLIHAFTHSSYVNERRLETTMSNERLEFLGDAVLELTVSEFLYRQFPDLPEGQLTKMRAGIVCEPSFASFATELRFGEYLLLGNGEEHTGGRSRAALLADVFEAFVAALYLDQGVAAVVAFLEKTVFPKVKDGAFSHVMDYKSELQEVLQKNGSCRILYKIISETGPAHDKAFVAVVEVNGAEYGRGSGKTKKEAEQYAASVALEKMKK